MDEHVGRVGAERSVARLASMHSADASDVSSTGAMSSAAVATFEDHSPAFATLLRDADTLLRAGLSERTRRAMGSRWARWSEFVTSLPFEVPIDPSAAPEPIWALYATFLAQGGLKKATIEQHLSSIRSWLADHGVAAPAQSGQLQRVLRGVPHNPLNAPQKPPALPRLPITAHVLMQMRGYIDHRSWNGALLWLASLLGVLGLLRAGEFTVDTDLTENERQRRMVRMRHLTLADDASSFTLHIPVTKTSQIDGARVVYARSANTALCPVAAWRAYVAVRASQPHRADARDDAPLLLTQSGTALRKRELVQQTRTVLQAAGIADEATLQRFSGHSYRRGGAQTLRDAGMSIDDIKAAGRWHSEVVQRYFSNINAVATAIAPMFAAAAAQPPPSADTSVVTHTPTAVPLHTAHLSSHTAAAAVLSQRSAMRADAVPLPSPDFTRRADTAPPLRQQAPTAQSVPLHTAHLSSHTTAAGASSQQTTAVRAVALPMSSPHFAPRRSDTAPPLRQRAPSAPAEAPASLSSRSHSSDHASGAPHEQTPRRHRRRDTAASQKKGAARDNLPRDATGPQQPVAVVPPAASSQPVRRSVLDSLSLR